MPHGYQRGIRLLEKAAIVYAALRIYMNALMRPYSTTSTYPKIHTSKLPQHYTPHVCFYTKHSHAQSMLNQSGWTHVSKEINLI